MKPLNKILMNDLLQDSYSGDYTEILKVISGFLKQHTDAEVIIQKVDDKKANLIACFGEPELLINCHMDTVPPNENWDSDPTSGVIKEDKIFGLGTTDTKGNIYALLECVKAERPVNLLLLFSVDEESGGIESGVTHFLGSSYVKGVKKAVVCEPTNLQVVSKHKGYYSFLIDFHAGSGHSSNLLKADNAIVMATEYIPLLVEKGYNVAKISGGVRGNIIPAKCSLQVSIRTYREYSAVCEELEQLLDNAGAVTKLTNLPHFSNTAEQGMEVGFWTEAALFQQAGISTVVLGAGNISQAHKENEFISLKELEKAQDVFLQLIRGKI